MSNYIKGKFCESVCVSVRYRTYLNVVEMGSKLLGVLRKTLRWSSNGQMFKKLSLKNRFFQMGNGRITGKRTGNKNRNGGGTGGEKENGGGSGKCFQPEQCRVPPTSSGYIVESVSGGTAYSVVPDGPRFDRIPTGSD
jgi:hypothetical protein